MIGNILIVDDEASSLKLLKEILTAEKHTVRPFTSGELALRSIVVEAPELILLDIRMPGMNGFEVCRRIKGNEQSRDIPVIFISSASDIEDKILAFQEGGVDYITKPFQREEVLTRVGTHIALSHSMQRLKQTAAALRKSEESLKLAQTIAHLGHWELDIKSGQFNWSDELYRILDIQPQGPLVSRETLLQSVHPDDREQVTNHLNEVMTGHGFDIEYRIILRTGRIRVVHATGNVFIGGSGHTPKIVGTIQDIDEPEQMKMLGVIQDITERRELQRQLEEQAHTDFLTGCESRRHFLEHAEVELLRSHRYGGELSLLMLDLDHFKNVNDRHGHHIGDKVLIKVIQVCKELLRDVDIIGRLGGEEFAILLPETESKQALKVAERLCQAVAKAEVPLEEGPALRFTTSIGVAGLATTDLRIDELLNRADIALYQAKADGRNRARL